MAKRVASMANLGVARGATGAEGQDVVSDLIAIFDLDGTLVDSWNEVLRALELSLRGTGFSVPDNWRRECSQSHLSAGELLTSVGVPPSRVGDLTREFRSHLKSVIGTSVQALPGAESTLRALRERGVSLCVATNKPDDLANETLRAVELDSYFDAVVGVSSFPPKPSPVMLQHCVASSGRAEGVMIGDSWKDVAAAHAANVRVILVGSPSSATSVPLRREDCHVLSMYDVLSAIERG